MWNLSKPGSVSAVIQGKFNDLSNRRFFSSLSQYFALNASNGDDLELDVQKSIAEFNVRWLFFSFASAPPYNSRLVQRIGRRGGCSCNLGLQDYFGEDSSLDVEVFIGSEGTFALGPGHDESQKLGEKLWRFYCHSSLHYFNYAMEKIGESLFSRSKSSAVDAFYRKEQALLLWNERCSPPWVPSTSENIILSLTLTSCIEKIKR